LNTEVEIKLDISREDRPRLNSSELLGDPEETVQQRSIYFDTCNHDLFKSGFTLRIRRIGETYTQAVKAAGAVASLFARSVWEQPLTDERPVFDHTTPLQREFGDILQDLEPQFTVEVERQIWRPKENGADVEVVADQGLVRAGDRETRICEIEIELKDGDRNALFGIARKIEAVVPLRFGIVSKAGRGYRLIAPRQLASKAEPIELDRSMRAIEAFQAIASACFRQFRLNEEILRCHANPEALHQARVALRRMRSAFSLFKDVVSDAESPRLNGELRHLAGVLGKARDVDVLLSRKPRGDLRDRLEEVRKDRYEDASDALNGFRGRALMLDLNEWLHSGDYLSKPTTAEERDRPAADYAAFALDQARKKLRKHGKALAHVDDEQRHQARKDTKNFATRQSSSPLSTTTRKVPGAISASSMPWRNCRINSVP